jgi:hypothetical protein
MADAIVDITLDSGNCSHIDLQMAGFSAKDVAAHASNVTGTVYDVETVISTVREKAPQAVIQGKKVLVLLCGGNTAMSELGLEATAKPKQPTFLANNTKTAAACRPA